VSGILPSFLRNAARKTIRVSTAVLTVVLLTPFFYLVFVPARIILVLRGIDPLDRKFPSGGTSCWVPRRWNPDPARHRRQFS
jgi:hypothetical protein